VKELLRPVHDRLRLLDAASGANAAPPRFEARGLSCSSKICQLRDRMMVQRLQRIAADRPPQVFRRAAHRADLHHHFIPARKIDRPTIVFDDEPVC
jgi:hypothetical protein